jgi:hypothetical protein
VISLREAAKQLGDRAEKGASAELLKDAAAKVQGHGAVVKILFGVTAPDAQKSIETDVAAAADAVAKGDKAKAAASAKAIVATCQAQAPKVAAKEFDAASTKKILADIAASGEAIGAVGVRGGEQGAMALDRLYSAYSKSPGQKADKAASDALDKIFGTIEDPKKFDGKAFATQAKAFGDTLK